MPVVLPPDAYELWLDPGFTKREGIVELLQPLPPNAMKKYPVSTRVNTVKNDDPECAAPSPPVSLFA
jgi:putative SOS response-associated peptidase YedK